MKFKILFVSFLLLILIISMYCGAFVKIEIKEEKVGGETIVYEEMVGDYKNSGKVMDKIYYDLLESYSIETYKGVGIYYDNPQVVEKDKLRSEIGVVIEEKDLNNLEEVRKEYRVKQIEEKNYVVSKFPYKGQLSIMFGIMRVYPRINKYLDKHNISQDGFVMEIYDTPNKVIEYRKEIISNN